jgi:diketogulonate reductase-like aldo/keto reductase
VTQLNDGREIPELGLGTFGVGQAAVEAALAAGYRHIDTASVYGNEEDVGRALQASGLSGDEIWVTTKLWNSDHGRPRRALEESLTRLGLDAVDLYLIHWPVGDWVATWRSFGELRSEGLARSIGVSNFTHGHLDALGDVVPAIDQIELSPFLYGSSRDTVERCRQANIVVEAYSPLTRGHRLGHPVLARIAERHGKSPAQVLIRWCIDHGFVVIPRSSRPERIRGNAEVFDFGLDPAELAELDGLGDKPPVD